MADDAIEIRDVGPIEHLSIPVPEGGGIVVIRGRNGLGKTHGLQALNALTGAKSRPPTRDGSLGAQVEGLGARLTIGRRASKSGEIVVSHLEGEDPGQLVDPGLKSPEAADAARIKALLRLARARVDVSAFAGLVGSEDRLRELCRAESLAGEDVPTMAASIKRDLEAAARKAEQAAENGFARADGVRATLQGLEGEDAPERRCESAQEAREQHTQAIREHSALESRRHDGAASVRAAEEARAALAELGDDGTPERLQAAEEQVTACRDEVARIEALLRDAEAKRDAAVREQARQERAAKQRAPLQRSIEAAAEVVEVSDEQLEQAAQAVQQAEAELSAWTLHERTERMREEMDQLSEQAQEASREGAALREAARGTEQVILQAVRDVCGDDMEIHEGRLYVQTDDRGLELFCERSHGERWRKALDIAAEAVGTEGLLVVSQEAYASLDPVSRREVAEHARKLGLVIVTAECDEGDLRAEVQS